MKRKNPHRRKGLDPRDFAWHKCQRDHWPDLGDRVWMRTGQCRGSIVRNDTDAVSTTSSKEKDDDGPGQQNEANNQRNTQKVRSMDEPSGMMVRLDDGSNTTMRRRVDAVRIYPVPAILICHSTDDFRLLAQTQDIGPNVLEIGCSTGQTSRILWQRCDRWMGWDTGQAMVDKLQEEINTKTKRGNALLCRKIDTIVDPESAWRMVDDHFGQTTSKWSCLTVMIDIGGNREAQAVGKILQWALELPVFHNSATTINSNKELRLVIIKSEEWFALDDPMGWFLALVNDDSVTIKTFPSHPLKAPKRCSPQDPTLPVCRYHNYHRDGCKKGGACELDHTYCHWCLTAGHIALYCPDRLN